MSVNATRLAVVDGAEGAARGASAAAICAHYDVGVDFFRLWLDPSLTYSAARWRDPLGGAALATTLAQAQIGKLDFHLAAARIGAGSRLLDVGCGWGSLLVRAVTRFGAALAEGLTLSRDQFDYVNGLGRDGVRVHLRSYEAFIAPAPYDGIVSIGAFEHFARPGLDRAEKVRIYRGFFARMHAMLADGGRLSLQTIAWGRVARADTLRLLPQDIFPESDVPFLDEILDAAADHFEIVYLEQSADDYIATLRTWHHRIAQQRAPIIEIVGDDGYAHYDRYMRRAIAGFERRRMLLFRIVFAKAGRGRRGQS